MVRARARNRGRRLDDIEAAHLETEAIRSVELIQLAAPVKLSHVADIAGPAGEEIGVKRKDDLGILRAIHRVDVIPESELCALARSISDGRFPLMPFRHGIQSQKALQIRGKQGRIDDSTENAEPFASRCPQCAGE